MSKSLGNLVMVSDLLETWSPDALRLYLARHHYREVWSYEEAEMAEAARWAETLRMAAEAAPAATRGKGNGLDPSPFRVAVEAALDEDLDSPRAVWGLLGLGQEIMAAAAAGRDVEAAQDALRELAAIFGLRLDRTGPEPRVQKGWDAHAERFA